MLNNMMEKMAKKAFESNEVQKSWQVHAQAFSPLLEEAFEHSYTARVHLTNALNHLSRRQLERAMELLNKLEPFCKTDADHAARYVFIGLCYEMSGARYEMCSCYQKAGKYGNSFYLPYLKVAKSAFEDKMYQLAAAQYLRGAVLLEEQQGAQTPVVLPAAYTGCAVCHVMMHNLKEAEAYLQAARKVSQDARGIATVAAIFHAAKQEPEQANAMLETARQQRALPPETESMVTDILSGTHPHFFAQPINEAQIPVFWQWFEEQLPTLEKLTAEGEGDELLRMMEPQLLSLFPVGMERPEYGVEATENGLHITLCHCYSRTVEQGYQALLRACPEALHGRVAFTLEA